MNKKLSVLIVEDSESDMQSLLSVSLRKLAMISSRTGGNRCPDEVSLRDAALGPGDCRL